MKFRTTKLALYKAATTLKALFLNLRAISDKVEVDAAKVKPKYCKFPVKKVNKAAGIEMTIKHIHHTENILQQWGNADL